MGVLVNFVSSFLSKATITYKAPLSAGVYHIQLQGKALQQADYGPGYFLRMLVGKNKDLSFDDNVRSYSVWKLDPVAGIADLAVYTHANGSGSAWAKDCAVGNVVAFRWHKSNLSPESFAAQHLFIGDISALGHLYAIRRSLPDTKQTKSIIYSNSKDNFFADIYGARPFDFYELAADPGTHIIQRIPQLIAGFSDNSVLYMAGDSRVCVQVNQYFRKELHWPTRRIKTKPFWNPLKKGLE